MSDKILPLQEDVLLMPNNMERALERFMALIYAKLNKQQRAVVDSIADGDVLTIGSPGTGKTQTLSAALLYLYFMQGIDFSQVLLLTFTDAARDAATLRLERLIMQCWSFHEDKNEVKAFAMRCASALKIETFHSYAARLIRENQGYLNMIDFLPLSEIEQIHIIRKIISDLPVSSLLKRASSPFHASAKLVHLFGYMRQHDLDGQKLEHQLNQRLQELDSVVEQVKLICSGFNLKISKERTACKREIKMAIPIEMLSYFYLQKRGNNNVGDVKEATLNDYRKQIAITKEAGHLLGKFNTLVRQKKRYTYADAIHIATKVLQDTNTDVLLQEQEQYQVVFVDEAQDMNRSQFSLLDALLTDRVADGLRPYCAMFGDNKQCVYRFNYANPHYMTIFVEVYQAKVLTLTTNYRSGQAILDYANHVVKRNPFTLTSVEDAMLVAGADRPCEIDYHIFDKAAQEEAYIFDKAKRLIDSGVPYSDICIAANTNAELENFVKVFDAADIPYFTKRKINVLRNNVVQFILKCIHYFAAENRSIGQGDKLLHKIMTVLLNYNDVSNIQQSIRRINAVMREKGIATHLTMRTFIQSRKLLESLSMQVDIDAILAFSNTIEHLVFMQPRMSFYNFFLYVITSMDIDKLEGKMDGFSLEVNNTFLRFVKEQAQRNPNMTIQQLSKDFEVMEEEGLRISLEKIDGDENGIFISTAHGLKGLEFPYVFFFGLSGKKLEFKSNRRQGFYLPMTVTGQVERDFNEEAVNLLYVAVTRAEEYLHLSYHKKKEDGKSVGKVSTLLDGNGVESKEIAVSSKVIEAYLKTLHAYQPAIKVVSNDIEIDSFRKSFVISPTSLTEYNRCRLAFYNKYVARFPQEQSDRLAFGNVIDETLNTMYMERTKDALKQMPSLERMLEIYEALMVRDESNFSPITYPKYLIDGKRYCQLYYDDTLSLEMLYGNYIPQYSMRVRLPNGILIHTVTDRTHLTYNAYKNKPTVVKFKALDHKMTEYKASRFYDFSKPIKDNQEPNSGGAYFVQAMFQFLAAKHHYSTKADDTFATYSYYPEEIGFDFLEPKAGTDKIVKKRYSYEDLEPYAEEMMEKIAVASKNIYNGEFEGCNKPTCSHCNEKRIRLRQFDNFS